MNENENTHPADEILDVAVDAIMGAESAADAVALLGAMAGGVEKAFLNVVLNTPHMALRMVVFRLLSDFHAAGDDDSVMKLLDATSIATVSVEPNSLDVAVQEYRDHYDKDFGA